MAEHRARPRLRRWLYRGAVPVALVLASFTLALRLDDLPPPIHVRLGSGSRSVLRSLPPGTTLGAAARAEGLRPRDGNLVDVEGLVLTAGKYPGHFEVGGQRATRRVVLEDGNTVTVVHGRNRTEPLAEQIVPIPGGQVGNPQTFLGTAPGEQIITKGSISGKVVSSVFRPTGPVQAPLEVALTFDDGPSTTYTPQVLDVLKRFHIKATFFVVGTMAERAPDLVRRERREGMVVGNHTYSHPYHPPFATLTRKTIKQEMDRNDEVLTALGVHAKLFRPPGGSWSDFVIEAAKKRGMRTVLWAVDPRDYTRPAPKPLAKSILDVVRPGSIILMHDGGGDRSNTVAALPRIIRGLLRMGLKPVTIT